MTNKIWIVFSDKWSWNIKAVCSSEDDAKLWIENHSSIFDLFYREYLVGGNNYDKCRY